AINENGQKCWTRKFDRITKHWFTGECRPGKRACLLNSAYLRASGTSPARTSFTKRGVTMSCGTRLTRLRRSLRIPDFCDSCAGCTNCGRRREDVAGAPV